MRKILIIALGILAVPLSAFPQTEGDHNRIIHGVSVSYLLFPLDNSSDDVHGIGVNYDFSMPISQSRFHFRTGIGFSHYYSQIYINQRLWFQPIDKLSTVDITFMANYMSNPDDIDYYTIKETAEEYNYVSVPVNIGFKLLDKNGFTLTPYLGILMKYNLSLIEKIKCDNFSLYDTYVDCCEKDLFGETRRFMFQYDFGIEIGYRHLYGIASYERDFNPIFKNRKDADVLDNWRFGLGFRF